MLNQVILIGRLTKDPETRMLPGGQTQVANFTLAVDRSYKGKDGEKKTDFLLCEAFGKTAEFISNYLVKGRLVAIQGEINVDRYEKDGEKKSITKIKVASIKALDKKGDSGNTQDTPPGFSAMDDSDIIPF